MKIGIGISTTPERFDVFDKAWDMQIKYQPAYSRLASLTDHDRDGVAKTKNALLSRLDDCDHIFLFDDDCWPIAKDWFKPYVQSKELHLMYQFDLPGRKKMDLLHADGEITAWSHTRGAMIYTHRSVLDVVGGMDERYKFGYEHTDWSNRIHNAGLTTYRAMDVSGSNKLLYCLDQDSKVNSSVPDSLRRREQQKNYQYYRQNRESKEYKEYR